MKVSLRQHGTVPQASVSPSPRRMLEASSGGLSAVDNYRFAGHEVGGRRGEIDRERPYLLGAGHPFGRYLPHHPRVQFLIPSEFGIHVRLDVTGRDGVDLHTESGPLDTRRPR